MLLQRLRMLPCLILLNTVLVTLAEYFTSSTHLNALLKKEIHLRDLVRDYINEKELRLNVLKRFYARTVDIEKYITPGNVTLYAGNPLFLYSSMNRLTKDWDKVKDLANRPDGFLSSFSDAKDYFPSTDDLYGAKSAILRLQETFALPTRTIMDGIGHYGSRLDVVDAYHIGYTAFQQKKPHQTASWMKEVLRMLSRNTTYVDFDVTKARFEALDVLSWAEYQVDNLLASYKYTKELLEIDPDHKRINDNLGLIEDAIIEENITLTNETLEYIQPDEEPEEIFAQEMTPYQSFYYMPEEDEGNRYEMERARANALCRGETDPIPLKYQKYLLCWYKRNHPLLVLKPAKVERLYPHPEIIMFRDIISESEMNRIKDQARPLLKRATVNNPLTGKLEAASYRVSKSAWIGTWHDPELVNLMNDRIDAITGLDMKYAEELQIANYGIGGFYEPHFDFARIVPIRPPPWKARDDYTRQKVSPHHHRNTDAGERIATILFYMSEVISGGATVFTNIGQAVSPSKGDAVFWHNLLHDGSGDYLTRHAACPVLIGEKWVCNRWLHEFGQEFRRPCKLRHDDDWW